MPENNKYHEPVLLKESIEGLEVKPNGTYIDVTFGGGGHSAEILKRLSENGRLIAFDQDPDSEANQIDDNRFTFVQSNFIYITNFLRYYSINKVDGILADLGVSSYQFNKAERGFSFRFDAGLDMRMNRTAKISAKEVVNNYSQTELEKIFRRYGEIKNARKMAIAIAQTRQEEPINTVKQLMAAIAHCIPKKNENKALAKVFQALRIEVNKEIENLENFLLKTPQIIKQDGRLVVITYHSLEDRAVKNFIKTGNMQGNLEKDIYGHAKTPFSAVNRKVIVPSDEEIQRNNRARSAKLRIARRTEF